jgi:hypothetical protein
MVRIRPPKIHALRKTEIVHILAPSCIHKRDATRSSRVLDADAMDVSAQARLGARTNEFEADGQAVWSRHPDAGVKFCGDDPQGDGG